MSVRWALALLVLCGLSFYTEQARGARCPQPRLANGRARVRQAGQLAKFSCAAGFQLVGDRYASCRNGRWDVGTPVCVKPGCPAMVVENALQIQLHGGAWVLFFCKPGHRSAGPSAVYCNGRTWNGTAPVCVVATELGGLSCDFEEGLCGWAQDELHDFDWKRWSGRTPSAFMFTGPSHDHTRGAGGTGSYMYLEATSRLENDTARLLSPVYYSELAVDGCFSFFYHMFGRGTGGLRVYQRPQSEELPALLALPLSARRRYLLFERWGDQGDSWYGAVVSLNDFQENFQLVVEGVRGASFTSDIALDDVALLPAARCDAARAAAPTPAPPPAVESCAGRCEGEAEVVRRVDACGCGAACLGAGDCCPDYFDLCGFPVTAMTSEYASSTGLDADGGRLPDQQPLVAASVEPTPSRLDATPPLTEPTVHRSTVTSSQLNTTVARTNSTLPRASASLPGVNVTEPPRVSPTLPQVNPAVSRANRTLPRVNSTLPRVHPTVSQANSTVPRVNTTLPQVAPTVVRNTARLSTRSVPLSSRAAVETHTQSATHVTGRASTNVSNATIAETVAIATPVRNSPVLSPNPTSAGTIAQWQPGPATTRSPTQSPTTRHQTGLQNREKIQQKKLKGAAPAHGLLVALACVLAAACCIGAGWAVWRGRARSPLALARLRARAQRHSEVRFLTSDVDD